MIKCRYTLIEANEKIKTLASEFPLEERSKYRQTFAIGHSTLHYWLKGTVPSLVAANHLAEYMEQYVANQKVQTA